MKIKFLFLLMPLLAISQSKPFYKQIMTAYEINKTDTINKKILITYLDKARNIVSTENNFLNATAASRPKSSATHSITEVDSDRLYILTDIDEKGNPIEKLIYVYDDKKNMTEYYQLRNGDTITGQKRVYNEFGKCIKLYNKQEKSHKYLLNTDCEYDFKGNKTQSKTYNEYGELTEHYKYENVYNKNEFIATEFLYSKGSFEKRSKLIKQKHTTTAYYYYNNIGYNYGIKIKTVNGGMSITELDKRGNMKEFKIFDANNNLIAYVKNSEMKIKN